MTFGTADRPEKIQTAAPWSAPPGRPARSGADMRDAGRAESN